MIKGRDIIIVGQQAWDVEIGSNCKDIALEFCKDNRVLYVNPALDRITKMRNSKDPKVIKRLAIINGQKTGLIKVKKNLWIYYPDVLIESINWIRIHKLFLFFNNKNNQRIASSINKAIRKIRFKNFLLFNDSDIFRSFHLKELLTPTTTIYYSRDNIIATEYWKRHGQKLEPELIRKSDLCVANSQYLVNYCKKYNSNSYYVGQGCDFTINPNVDLSVMPDELKAIQNPIVGYVGTLTSSRLSIQLIEYIATNAPYWNIVLVGPEDEDFKASSLHKLKNVFFLGPKKPMLLFQYINAFDVCINPQALNQLTIGNYPRKIDEYLLMGKPIVATYTQTMESFSNHVFLAKDNEEFVGQIAKALLLNDKALSDARMKFAFTHSWENSVKAIFECIVRHQTLSETNQINL